MSKDLFGKTGTSIMVYLGGILTGGNLYVGNYSVIPMGVMIALTPAFLNWCMKELSK